MSRTSHIWRRNLHLIWAKLKHLTALNRRSKTAWIARWERLTTLSTTWRERGKSSEKMEEELKEWKYNVERIYKHFYFYIRNNTVREIYFIKCLSTFFFFRQNLIYKTYTIPAGKQLIKCLKLINPIYLKNKKKRICFFGGVYSQINNWRHKLGHYKCKVIKMQIFLEL